MDSSTVLMKVDFFRIISEIRAFDKSTFAALAFLLALAFGKLQIVRVMEFFSPSAIHAGWTPFSRHSFLTLFQLCSSHLPIHPCSIACELKRCKSKSSEPVIGRIAS